MYDQRGRITQIAICIESTWKRIVIWEGNPFNINQWEIVIRVEKSREQFINKRSVVINS